MHAMAVAGTEVPGPFGTRMVMSVPGSCGGLGGIVCEGTRRFVVVVWADVNAVVALEVVMDLLGRVFAWKIGLSFTNAVRFPDVGAASQTTALEVCVV
jgi:hypothetical protein